MPDNVFKETFYLMFLILINNNKERAVKSLLVLAGSLILVLSLSVQADVREVFVCSYNDGKDMDDLMSARDFYIKEAEKAGIETPTAFVWTPVKVMGTGVPDVLWFNTFDNGMAFAKSADAFAGSAAMEKVTDRFNSVMDCQSAIASREVMFDGGEFAVENPPAIIVSNACNMHQGIRYSDMGELWGHARNVLGGIEAYKNHMSFVTTPMTPGPGAPDLYLYSVHENMTAWATKRAAFQSSAGGALLASHFQSLLDCTTSVWAGQRVVPAMDAE
jgi:hypothetical protein